MNGEPVAVFPISVDHVPLTVFVPDETAVGVRVEMLIDPISELRSNVLVIELV